MLRLKCPCAKSEMIIVYRQDKSLRLTVPCFICPQPHNYTVSSQVFFDRELFSLPCAYSGIDVCLIGGDKAVSDAADAADRELMELMGEDGYDSFFDLKKDGEQVFTDPQILDIVNFVIRDLDEAGEITCRCPEDEGCYSVEVTGDGVTVKCERCGAMANIPVTSTMSAQAFLNCEHLELT